MKHNLIALAIVASTITPITYAQVEADYKSNQKVNEEMARLVTKSYRNLCFMGIKNNTDKQVGLNTFRISPSEICECAANEAAQALAASPNYRAYVRILINSSYTSNPPFAREVNQDEIIADASYTFDQSWANCFMRLKRV